MHKTHIQLLLTHSNVIWQYSTYSHVLGLRELRITSLLHAHWKHVHPLQLKYQSTEDYVCVSKTLKA